MKALPPILEEVDKGHPPDRTLTNYVETLLMRDLLDHDDNGKITVFAPEGLPDANDIVRDPGESDASYAERKEAIGAIIQAARQ